jgi:crotonobetainyl-CoA:carnitine CoA-transferase CaiB-like acyl-CoA transferase
MWPAIAAAQTGTSAARTGNGDSRMYWQGVLPTRGEDRWVAVSVRDKTEWARLMQLTAGLAPEKWSADQNDAELAQALQREGIAAGAVQDMADLVDRDPVIAARGALVMLDHPKLGAFGHVRTPMSFSVDDIRPYRAPALGEHTWEVARTLAGMTEDRLQELQKLGVFE